MALDCCCPLSHLRPVAAVVLLAPATVVEIRPLPFSSSFLKSAAVVVVVGVSAAASAGRGSDAPPFVVRIVEPVFATKKSKEKKATR